jgi:fructose-1,6-bisphosphatase I
MTEHETLACFLEDWAGEDASRHAVADTIRTIGEACCAISEIISLGPLAGDLAARRGENVDGDTQAALDVRANKILLDELQRAPVACVASEELDLPEPLNAGAPLCVAVDPLDGSSNIDTNVSVGTIFSVLPMRCEQCRPGPQCFVQKGNKQLAAGYAIYGPQTALVLTVGEGTHIFTLNPDTGEFCLTRPNVEIPEDTNEFAINTSNFRRWDGHIRAYVDDCLKGADGPHAKNYNTRWIASLVAECHRIMARGGIFLYPGDRRPDYQSGRLRLAYECSPIAFLVEQANGKATTGYQRILDLDPSDLHERVPLIFGSANEVELVNHYYEEVHPFQERWQLFGDRGLFRAG